MKLLNIRVWENFTEVSEVSGFDSKFLISWSQGGEDLALSHFLKSNSGKYLDVGAHHPSRFSVTRHLYQSGWSGVNVEANSALIAQFNKTRKRDLNLWNAVGSEAVYTLNVFEESAISTVSDKWKDKFISENQDINRVEEVNGISLRKIFDNHFKLEKCNLLTIDIEGADFDAIKSLDLESLDPSRFPDWILLETSPPIDVALATDSVTYVKRFGYIPYLVLPMSTLLKSPILNEA